MKNTVFALFFLAFLFTGTRVYAQPAFPDYSGWDNRSSQMNLVHNGKNITVRAEEYRNLDHTNLTYCNLFIIYNEQNQSWLGFYVIAKIQITGDEMTIVAANFYLFENNGGQWSFVREFSEEDLEKETKDFLKSRYDLEFGQ